MRNRGASQGGGSWIRSSTRLSIYERDDYTCQFCGLDMSDADRSASGPLTVDHIVPRDQGGSNAKQNLVTACRTCNSKNLTVDEKRAILMGKAKPKSTPAEPGVLNIRNRIVEFRDIPSDQLLDNEGNPRRHPSAQRNAMAAVLREIGVVQALVVYRSQRAGGKLVVIDGHMRKNDFPLNSGWPCLVVDLTDEEADKQLLAHDPVALMAHTDRQALEDLRAATEFEDASVDVMLDSLERSMFGRVRKKSPHDSDLDELPDDVSSDPVPEMELQPYEHYDYMLVVCRNSFDWNYLLERVGLEHVDGSNDRRFPKIGLGRAVDAGRLIELLRQAEQAQDELAKLQKKPSTKRKPS